MPDEAGVRVVSTSRPRMFPFIIAEGGSCHEGSLERAAALTAVAAEAGADAIKWQYWSSPERMRERRGLAGTAYDAGSVPEAWLLALRAEAHRLGLTFACSVFLPEDVPAVVPLLDIVKVASFEARDDELLAAILVARHRGVRSDPARNPPIPLIVSTGMQTLEELEELARALPDDTIYLHCVSAYPCPLGQANLDALRTWRFDGYSDHTRDPRTGGLAVAAGARYLEAHLRLDTTSTECPDYPVALAPDQFAAYVRFAREAWAMLGDGVKRPQPAELDNLRYRVGAAR